MSGDQTCRMVAGVNIKLNQLIFAHREFWPKNLEILPMRFNPNFHLLATRVFHLLPVNLKKIMEDFIWLPVKADPNTKWLSIQDRICDYSLCSAQWVAISSWIPNYITLFAANMHSCCLISKIFRCACISRIENVSDSVMSAFFFN